MKCISLVYLGYQRPGVLISRNPLKAFVYRNAEQQWIMTHRGELYDWFDKFKMDHSVTLINLNSDTLGVNDDGEIMIGQWVDMPKPMYKTTLHNGRPFRVQGSRMNVIRICGHKSTGARYWAHRYTTQKIESLQPIPTQWLVHRSLNMTANDSYVILDPLSTIFNSFRSTLVEVVGKDA